MAGKRSYRDLCGIARALDLVGERWALLVVRELLLGPKRFTDLRTGLPHVSPDVLAQRLRELEQAGILTHERLPPPAAAQVYALTPWGRGLEPVLLGLGRWASATAPPEGAVFGPDSAMLALKSLFDPGRAHGVDVRVELRFGDQRFRVTVVAGTLTVERGPAADPDAVVETSPGALAAVLWHGRGLSAAVAAGELAIAGNATAVGELFGLFPQGSGGRSAVSRTTGTS